MTTVEQALSALRDTREMYQVDHALQALTELRNRADIASLYRRWFPRLYRRSTSLCYTWCHEQRDSCATREARGLEEEFFLLIDRHLFPLCNTEASEILDYCYPLIPVAFCNYNSDADFSEEALPIQILARLVGCYYDAPPWDVLHAQLPYGTPTPLTLIDANAPAAWAFDSARLRRFCHRYGGIVAHLPSALEVMAHETGTIFLDLDADSGYENDYTWTDESLKDLHGQWKRAKRFLDRLTKVTQGMTHHPELWNPFFTMWNQCCSHSRQRAST